MRHSPRPRPTRAGATRSPSAWAGIAIIRTSGILAALALIALPSRLAAQAPATEESLGTFVDHFAHLWSEADVEAIVQLLPERQALLLDAGSGIESANSRHAAAALRALFADNETTQTTAIDVTVASTDPAQGFGELTWTYRARGAPGEQARSIYVATRRENGDWKITELRLMP